MYCTSCGSQAFAEDRFCRGCGNPMVAGATRPAPPRLVRIRSEKKLGGVCAGFAHYFNIDVTLLRLITVIAAIMSGGVGVIAYIVAWIVMPEATFPPATVSAEPAPPPPPPPDASRVFPAPQP